MSNWINDLNGVKATEDMKKVFDSKVPYFMNIPDSAWNTGDTPEGDETWLAMKLDASDSPSIGFLHLCGSVTLHEIQRQSAYRVIGWLPVGD